jgi:hypothetical protein
MLCSAHAALRDRYSLRALFLDLGILGLSTWLVAVSLIDPRLEPLLTPWGWEARIWVGVLGAFVFFLSLVQIKTDWKGRADAHRQALEIYAEVKREAGYLLATEHLEDEPYRRVLARYDMASAVGVAIPEKDFLDQKRRHVIKIEMSRHLDAFPSSSIFLRRLQIWCRDNIRRGPK